MTLAGHWLQCIVHGHREAPLRSRSEMSDQQAIGRQDLAGAVPAAWRILIRARLEYVFLVIALVWGVAQVFLMPPLQVPDEGDHWFRAWAMTDGQFTLDDQGELTLPGAFARTVDIYLRLVSNDKVLPSSLNGQPGFSGYEDLFDGPGPPGTVRVLSRVANYGPIGYLPQAVGVAVGRAIGAPPLVSFYLARLANLLAAVALLFFAIRLAPFGKQLFVLLALLPVTMMEFASVSCDALTIAGTVLFISLVLWASARVTLRRMDVVLLLSSAAIFLNVKPGYWALILLVLLIKPMQLGNGKRYLGFVVAAGVAVIVGYLLVGSFSAPISAAAGLPNTQLSFVVHQPLDFLGIVWSNLADNMFRSAASIGILGWMTVALPPVFYAIAVSSGFVFFFWMGEDVHLELRQRALMAAVAVAVFLTIAIALYAFLAPIGSRQITFQGRYLVPVWLLLLLSAYGSRIVQRRRRGAPLLAGALVLMMVLDLGTIISSYYL
jgi:hypothetical protein